MSSRSGIDLFYVPTDGGDRAHVGAFSDLTAAKRRSRIDYRGGIAGGSYRAISRDTFRAVEEWIVVGNPNIGHHTDCVKLWPPDADAETPTAPEAACNHLPAFVNRVAYLLKRIGRRVA